MKVILLNIISLWIIDYFSTSISFKSAGTMIVTALVLGLLELIIKPILSFLSIPITILTLGLFSFVINGFILYLAFSFVDGAYIKSFPTAMLLSIVMTILFMLLEKLF